MTLAQARAVADAVLFDGNLLQPHRAPALQNRMRWQFGVLAPRTLVDVSRLELRGVRRDGELLRIGAMTTMAELAADPLVVERVPAVSEALLASASPQLRNMATIGGNLLQRTRCRYFRDPSVRACNKRERGTGCAAQSGGARMHAILGAGPDCIAVHGSDLAVALTALDARVRLRGQ